MTDKEISDYLYDGILLELEDNSFAIWYDHQYQHTSQRKVRLAAFRKEMIRRLTLIHNIAARCELFEALEKVEDYISREI